MLPFLLEWRKSLAAPAIGVGWTVLSVVTVVAGPFGTHDQMSLGERAIYWPLVVGLSILMGTLVRMAARRWIGGRGFFTEAPAIALALALLLSPLIHTLTRWIADSDAGMPLSWHELAFYVFVASLAISALREALAGARAEAVPAGAAPMPAAAPEPDIPQAGPRLLARLEPALHAPLVRLSVNDHYVEVVTEAGATNLLMRFADALAEIEAAPGLRVHRSHWVADGAVLGARRTGGRVILLLSDGAEVPVSRPHLAAVEARGWTTGE